MSMIPKTDPKRIEILGSSNVACSWECDRRLLNEMTLLLPTQGVQQALTVALCQVLASVEVRGGEAGFA